MTVHQEEVQSQEANLGYQADVLPAFCLGAQDLHDACGLLHIFSDSLKGQCTVVICIMEVAPETFGCEENLDKAPATSYSLHVHLWNTGKDVGSEELAYIM
jgi:hypothetical protein